MRQESGEVIAIKAAPAVGYIGATLWGLSIPDWAALLACVYTLGLLIQMGYRLVAWIRARRRKYGRRVTDRGADSR